MREWLQITVAVIALLITIPIAGAIAIDILTKSHDGMASAPEPLDPSDVKITGSESGHGSGVHIGNGYILTAAHVIDQDQDYTVKASSGQVYKAAILWTAKLRDVALMRIEKPRMASSELDCRPLAIDQPVRSRGNPWSLQFVSMHGHVASEIREVGRWPVAALVDIPIGNGMSGGPVFTGTRVVGINIGTIDRRAVIGGVPSGFGVIVPTSAICELLAR